MRRTPLAARHRDHDQQQGDHDERNVDGEDQPPGHGVDQVAAGQWADDRRDPGPRGPRADGGAALGFGERDDDRQGAGGQERPERALDGTARDQHPNIRGGGAHQRGQPEPGDADREHAPLPEDVAERPADQDQRAQGEQVGVGHPLLARQAAAEVRADRGQRDVDGGGIESGDKRAHDRREQGEPLAPPARARRHPGRPGRLSQAGSRPGHQDGPGGRAGQAGLMLAGMKGLRLS
jgi:hypothetical protein